MKYKTGQQISVLIDEIEERMNRMMTLDVFNEDSDLKAEMGKIAANLADFFEFSLLPKLKDPNRRVS